MDIMDIQAVESKLSDVTVTPIPRSQVQNFYNYQQQREQREQQPQIQISAIHHPPRDRHSHAASSNDREDVRGGSSGHSSTGRDLYASHHSKRERDYHQQLSQLEAAVAGAGGMGANPVVTAAALQYAQQLQAQLALLQQQANTNASPSITLTPANPRAAALTSSLASSLSMTPIPNTTNTNNNTSSNNISITSNGGGSMATGPTPSQLKYPQSTSPLFLSNTQAAKLVAPVNSSNSIDLQSTSSSSVNTGANNTQNNGLTKYAQLLAVIEEMGRDIRPTYTGSRSSTERLKRGIVHARILVRECLMETERSARQ